MTVHEFFSLYTHLCTFQKLISVGFISLEVNARVRAKTIL